MGAMAERGSCVAGSDGGSEVDRWDRHPSGTPRGRRVVTLHATSGPQQVAPFWASPDVPSSAVGDHDDVPEPDRGAFPVSSMPASTLAESVFPFGPDLPYDPDPEAAAFLNAPRRPLGFYVAPFGTPPFGNPPTGSARSVYGDHVDAGRGSGPEWGPAWSAGA
jgi:hypothetical protein